MARKINADDLIRAIRNLGHTPRSYSGRCMYGRECVGVSMGAQFEAIELFAELRTAAGLAHLPSPTFDSLGRGIIAYWPSVEIPCEHRLHDEEGAS
jgi:hypothetical protein